MPHLVTKQQTETSPFGLTGFSLSGETRLYAMYDMAQLHRTEAPSFLTALTEPEELIRTWRQPGEATSIVTRKQIDSLERLYAFRRWQEVVQFLSEHPFLVALLQEAQREIETHFPAHRQLSLEVLTDPEAIDDRQLVLFIGTDLAPDEALAALHLFDKQWWFEASRASRGKLCIHVE